MDRPLIPPTVVAGGIRMAVAMTRSGDLLQASVVLTSLYKMDPLEGFTLGYSIAGQCAEVLYASLGEIPPGASFWAAPSDPNADESAQVAAALVAANRNDDLDGAIALWQSIDHQTRGACIAGLTHALAKTEWGY